MTNLDRDRVVSVFGDRTGLAERFVDLLTEHGVPRGLIGPREVDRLWDRDVLNSAVIAELSIQDGLVLATGGGAVMRPENRQALHAGGRVVYLHTSVEQQIDRTSRDRNRPLLRTANPAQVLRDLMAVRDPLYREVADIVIETDERPPRMVVQEILARLEALSPR